MHLCKYQRHELRTPADLIGTECRQCFNGRRRRCDDRKKRGLKLLRKLEEHGIDVSNIENKADKVAAAVQILAVLDIDPARADYLFRTNQAAYRLALEMVDKLAKVTELA